jgi:hypothetical protein
VRLVLNKSAAANTAGLLFQTGDSGRAELGTAGDDNLHLKVSPDGSAWADTMVFDTVSGIAGLLAPVRLASFAVASLPDAAAGPGQVVFVPDEVGGAVLAFSDGSAWRRVTDRAVVA